MMMDNAQEKVVAVGLFFAATTWVTTVLRIYVRAVMIKNVGLEDYLAVLALALFTASVIFALKGISISGGKHLTELDLSDIKKSMEWWFLLELFYTATITVIRASIAVFLLRLTTLRSQVIIIWFVISTITGYSIFYFFFVIFQCNPPSAFWTEVGGNSAFCVKPSTFGIITYVHSGLGALSDWTLALIPVFLVSRLQMNTRTKISVSMVLGLGGIAAIAVIIRIPYVRILVNSKDFLYDCTPVVIWTAIEPGLGLTSASLACLRPLFQAFLNHTSLFGNTARSRYTNSNPTYGGGGGGKSSQNKTQSRFSKSQSRFSMKGAGAGYIKSINSSSGKGDLEMNDFDMEMSGPGFRKGTVTTTIQSDGVTFAPSIPTSHPSAANSEKEMNSRRSSSHSRIGGGGGGGNRQRSESQSRLKWNQSGEGDASARDSVDGVATSVHEQPIVIRKTVEIRTMSGILL